MKRRRTERTERTNARQTRSKQGEKATSRGQRQSRARPAVRCDARGMREDVHSFLPSLSLLSLFSLLFLLLISFARHHSISSGSHPPLETQRRNPPVSEHTHSHRPSLQLPHSHNDCKDRAPTLYLFPPFWWMTTISQEKDWRTGNNNESPDELSQTTMERNPS